MTLLQTAQRLPTSGARAVASFELDGQTWLAVPQLAEDKPDEPAYMNGGNSNVDLILYRWGEHGFSEAQRLPVPGGEDAEFFRIGDRAFLATAGVRSGAGPYELNTDSVIFEWRDGRFVSFQAVPSFAAKQWRHFAIGERHFLALAQGVRMPGAVATNPAESMILEWDGNQFAAFQTVPSAWGYNWCAFRNMGEHYLAYADHHAPSILLRWTGATFVHHQTFEGGSGRAFCFLEQDGDAFLAFANLLGETVLLRWAGDRFESHQLLSGPGGRDFAALERDGSTYLVQVNFLTGPREAPVTRQQSVLYRFEDGRMTVVERFETFGAVDASFFTVGDAAYLAIAESLSEAVRFRTDSRIYRFG